MKAPDLTGQVLGGRYRIVKAIGKGGMASVYEAVQLDLGGAVAVKVIARELTSESEYVERFRREAMAAAQLGHPNIVKVMEFQHPPGEAPFLVMELLSGEPLVALVRRGPVQSSHAIDITLQVLAGLDAAHAQGIVHRDLKPGNVFLVPMAGGRTLVKLVDFGVAKLMDSATFGRLTQTGMLIGTPRYAAPEQITDAKSVDPRTDVYAAGVLLYCMLGGRPPFVSRGARLLVDIETAEPPDLRSLVPSLGPGLVAVVGRAMAKTREERFQSAREFADALGGGRSSIAHGRTSLMPAPGDASGRTRGELPVHRRSSHPPLATRPTPAHAPPLRATRASPRSIPAPPPRAHSPAPQPRATRPSSHPGVVRAMTQPMRFPRPSPHPGVMRASPAPQPRATRPSPHPGVMRASTQPMGASPGPLPARASQPSPRPNLAGAPGSWRPDGQPTEPERRSRTGPWDRSMPVLVGLGLVSLVLAAALGVGTVYLVRMLSRSSPSPGTENVAPVDLEADCREWERLACAHPDQGGRRYCSIAREALARRESQGHFVGCATWLETVRINCPDERAAPALTSLPFPPPTDIPSCDALGRYACTCGSGEHLRERCARVRTFLARRGNGPPSEAASACEAERVIIERLCQQLP